MTDLAEWLLVQIAEDERTAPSSHRWAEDTYYACPATRSGDPAETGDLPFGEENCDCGLAYRRARVLAECDAKRRIVEFTPTLTDLDDLVDSERATSSRDMVAHPFAGDVVLRLLALPYADRPGYLEEWRP